MKPTFFIFQLLTSLASLHAADAPDGADGWKAQLIFKDYCVECHNEKKHKDKLLLDDISFALDSVETADRWQKISNQINLGELEAEIETCSSISSSASQWNASC
ncbi:hypothetical protein [Prosthecobacter vanneervenii]|uniref:Cytochrome c1 n=1 Tax=Prosthecobacter vanneervenii TaxID=48466 RepID=A0A7W8DKM3_9BACT|nr:hypothetical protein [Prosthecobacter vanneervenii]MBB5033185.1 cytochrome c1 [Prosthecobacter vanneervenii]